jgi:hypothetical protein
MDKNKQSQKEINKPNIKASLPIYRQTKFGGCLLVLWPFLNPVLFLYLGGLLGSLLIHDYTYDNGFDSAFWQRTTLTVITHLVVFLSIPIAILYLTSLTKRFTIVFLTIAGLGALIQLFQWYLSDGLGRMDCGDHCVSGVVPSDLGSAITLLTALTLGVAYILVVIVALKRLRSVSLAATVRKGDK